jgi:hypothetical protein
MSLVPKRAATCVSWLSLLFPFMLEGVVTLPLVELSHVGFVEKFHYLRILGA